MLESLDPFLRLFQCLDMLAQGLCPLGVVHVIGYLSRVPDQNGISEAFYVVEIYHSSPEPSLRTMSLSNPYDLHMDLCNWCCISG